MDTDPVLEELMSQLGDFGPYQFRQHIFHILSAFLAGMHMLSLVTVAPTPRHRCFIPELDTNSPSNNATFDPEIITPFYARKSNGDTDFCHWNDSANNDPSTGCNGHYVYSSEYYESSRVMEWGLVCDHRWQRAMIQSIYMFGVLMGAIVLGSLADKYGRKTIFYISGICQLIAGLFVAFVPNFVVYCGILFFYGMFGSGGAYVTGFVLTMELIGGRKRTLCGTAFSAAFAVGVMVVAGWAAFIPSAQILQTIYALHSLLLIGHWWLVDESIRWLWGQGRVEEAVTIVEGGVKTNGGKPFDRVKFQLKGPASNGEVQESYGAADLFKTPTIRKRALNVAFNWFANSLVYYGLSLNTGSLEGNPNLILFLIGLAELPGYLIVICGVDKTGRRFLLTLLLLLGGSACITVAFIPSGLSGTVLGIVLVGKMAIAGSFAIIYNYTAELFPTVIRNSAVGFGACSARFSGMLTPLIGLLDTIDKQLPTLVFGGVAILAALLALFLPETLNKEMPQTIQDGERFGKGDTGYKTIATCIGRNTRRGSQSLEHHVECTEHLNRNGFNNGQNSP